jgi:hypothetical protein
MSISSILVDTPKTFTGAYKYNQMTEDGLEFFIDPDDSLLNTDNSVISTGKVKSFKSGTSVVKAEKMGRMSFVSSFPYTTLLSRTFSSASSYFPIESMPVKRSIARLMTNKHPRKMFALDCTNDYTDQNKFSSVVDFCAAECEKNIACRYFWVNLPNASTSPGRCCIKSGVKNMSDTVLSSNNGYFYSSLIDVENHLDSVLFKNRTTADFLLRYGSKWHIESSSRPSRWFVSYDEETDSNILTQNAQTEVIPEGSKWLSKIIPSDNAVCDEPGKTYRDNNNVAWSKLACLQKCEDDAACKIVEFYDSNFGDTGECKLISGNCDTVIPKLNGHVSAFQLNRAFSVKGTAVTYRHGQAWTDYVFKLQYRFQETGILGIVFRHHDNQNYYKYEVNQLLNIRRLIKVVDGKIFELGRESDFVDSIPRWVQCQIEVLGSKIKIYSDAKSTFKANSLIFDLDDKSISSGTIGVSTTLIDAVQTRNGGISWKDIHVNSITPDSGFRRSDGRSIIETMNTFTLTQWIYKDPSDDIATLEEDMELFGKTLKLNINSGEFYASKTSKKSESLQVLGCSWSAGSGNRDGSNQCNNAFDENLNSIARYRTGGSKSYSMEISLKSANRVEGVNIYVKKEGFSTGYSTIRIYTAGKDGTWNMQYHSNKLWGKADRSATTFEKSEEFGWNSWNQHLFPRPIANVEKIKIDTGYADQVSDSCVSMHEIQILGMKKSWNGLYGLTWHNLRNGWNELTLRHDHQNMRTSLFLNGASQDSFDNDFSALSVQSIFGGKTSYFAGSTGITYLYTKRSSDQEILNRYKQLRLHYSEMSCGDLKLEKEVFGEWEVVGTIEMGQALTPSESAMSKRWRISGFPDRIGSCSITKPIIYGKVQIAPSVFQSTAILESMRFISLWVSWVKTGRSLTVKVGTGTNPARESTVIMSYRDPYGLKLSNIAVGSPIGQNAYFRDVCFDAPTSQAFGLNMNKLKMPQIRSGIFDIDPELGQLSVKSAVLDHETTRQYSLLVSVSDGVSKAFGTIRIDIVDEPEPPMIRFSCAKDASIEACGHVAENSVAGTRISSGLVGIDQDSAGYDALSSSPSSFCHSAFDSSDLEFHQFVGPAIDVDIDLSQKVVYGVRTGNEESTVNTGAISTAFLTDKYNFTLPIDANQTSYLTDQNDYTVWNSPEGASNVTMRIDFGVLKCFDLFQVKWSSINTASVVEMTANNQRSGSSIQVFRRDKLVEEFDRVDKILFDTVCSSNIVVSFSGFSGSISIREIEIREATSMLSLLTLIKPRT